MARNNLPTHLRLHLHCLVRGTCADLVQVKRNVLCDDFDYTRRTCRRLGSLNLAGPVLKDPIHDKRCQNNEKQVRPLGNFLITGTGAFHLRLRRGLGTAVVQCLNIADLRVKFHLKFPLRREIAFFLGIECPRLVWPLGSAKTRARRWRVGDWRRSLSSARSRTRASTLMHLLRSDSVISANSS